MNTYRKNFEDGSWCIRVERSSAMPKAGDVVDVTKKDGELKRETLGEPCGNGESYVLFRVAKTTATRETTQLGDLGPLLALFRKAATHLKFPAIVLAMPLNDALGGHCLLRINVAGAQARHPGTLNVLSNDRNGEDQRDWFGRIMLDGNFEASPRASRNALANVVPALKAFAADPVGEAKKSARLTGRCCFCNQTLTDERSTAVGYGSTCADHFGLAWGARPAAFAEAV